MSPERPLPLPAHLRVGDHERGAVCDRLAAHYAAGRLSAAELDERLAAAVAAPTLGALRVLLADLPPDPPPPVRPIPTPRRWTALDVLALLAVVGGLGVALLTVLGLLLGASGELLVAGFLGGCVAAAGGGGLVHLAHRTWSRTARPLP